MEIQENKTRCFVCGIPIELKPDDPNIVKPVGWKEALSCWTCKRTYPPSLIKACRDTFHYALQTRSGNILEFTRARISGNWVTLLDDEGQIEIDKYYCPRGIDIHIHEISWVADAPTS